MRVSDIIIGVILLSQTTVGALGNTFLVYHYLLLYFKGCKLKFTDWILQHLIVANFLTLLCRGVPSMVSVFGLQDFLNDFGCKLTFCLHRIGRGMSISSTCFLSVFQAITISPKVSRWTQLKAKSPIFIASAVYMSWILSVIVNIAFPMYMTARGKNLNITSLKNFEYCFSIRHSSALDIFYAVLHSTPDAMFMLMMLWSSGYMVCILYRHKKRMKRIHKSNFSFRSSPEFRATKAILFLVSTFVFFYTISCILQTNNSIMFNPDSFMVKLSSVFSACFPAVSPFLVITH
ncbi:vomeronasal type-1 receptor 4-like [Acomys russatus]|uniref:vomeronasal type-1 receptor 4-like n=1 Tax=Acomys russatus TaxID=60746 RepID=UPI0021E214AE|nr:vomeronasal type-1 receptor 4-like [Acomys russatus]